MTRNLILAGAFALVAASSSQAAAEDGVAIFAGGCFWCVESDFDKVPGVTATVSGYIGGENDNPTYENHARYGHREAVRIEYDPAVTDYEQLLATFFRSVDPTDGGGQFCDRGFQYTTAVYTLSDEQQAEGEAALNQAAQQLGQALATEIVEASAFWPAEEYHQDFYSKNPLRYRYYRASCGRDQRVADIWGSDAMKGIPGS